MIDGLAGCKPCAEDRRQYRDMRPPDLRFQHGAYTNAAREVRFSVPQQLDHDDLDASLSLRIPTSPGHSSLKSPGGSPGRASLKSPGSPHALSSARSHAPSEPPSSGRYSGGVDGSVVR